MHAALARCSSGLLAGSSGCSLPLVSAECRSARGLAGPGAPLRRLGVACGRGVARRLARAEGAPGTTAAGAVLAGMARGAGRAAAQAQASRGAAAELGGSVGGRAVEGLARGAEGLARGAARSGGEAAGVSKGALEAARGGGGGGGGASPAARVRAPASKPSAGRAGPSAAPPSISSSASTSSPSVSGPQAPRRRPFGPVTASAAAEAALRPARVAALSALNLLPDRWSPLQSAARSWANRHRPWTELVPVTEAERRREAEAAAAQAAALALPPGGAARALAVLGRALQDATRAVALVLLFLPVVVGSAFASRPGRARAAWLRLLRRTLERAGPAFIKWGQWAATRRDKFPADMCEELEQLHSNAPAHSARASREAVKAAFGGFSVEDLFEGWSDAPMASGSIGQIHEATLGARGARLTNLPVGTRVAVKVRHPGVGTAVERDFALMLAAARALGRLPALAHLRLEESLAQFAAPLREQVDLSREALNLHEFAWNFRTVRDVVFPTPCLPLATPAVLVETLEAGDHISSYVARGGGAPFNSALSSIGARTMLRMMIVDSLVHADLHPGNILVRLEPVGGPWVGRATDLVRAALDAFSSWVSPAYRVAKKTQEPQGPWDLRRARSAEGARSGGDGETQRGRGEGGEGEEGGEGARGGAEGAGVRVAGAETASGVSPAAAAASLPASASTSPPASPDASSADSSSPSSSSSSPSPSPALASTPALGPAPRRVPHPPQGLSYGSPRSGSSGEPRAGFVIEPPAEWMRRPVLVLLDAGMATRLSASDTRSMCGLFDAFSRGDGRSMARYILAFSGGQQTCEDPEGFVEDLNDQLDVSKRPDGSMRENGAEELAGVLDTCREHHVSLPGHICATVVTTLVLEGWSHDLDPAHSTLSEVNRVLAAARGGWRGWLGGVGDAEILHRVPTFDDPITPPRYDPANLIAKKG